VTPEEKAEKKRAYERQRYANNRERLLARQKQYYRDNRDKVLDSFRRREYGLQPGDYERMLEAQGHKCGICGIHANELTGRITKLVVDHHHGTGRVRQLLCSNCNKLLGHARESKRILLAAIEYLETVH
jgi:hypothetical protein